MTDSHETLGQVGGYAGDPAVQAEWDERYRELDQLWSGNPNGTLVAETSDLPPGRALDVGCGEGADAVWLAGQGWTVTALEVSGVALERAAAHARHAGASIAFVHAELHAADLAEDSFDLVSAHYPVLRRTPERVAEHVLINLVASGGTLLFVHHAGMDNRPDHNGIHDHDGSHDHEFDPADFVWPADIAALLGDAWVIEVNEQRPRVTPESGAGAHHAEDLVLKARRVS